MTPKQKKMAKAYGDPNKITRGDIITLAKKKKGEVVEAKKGRKITKKKSKKSGAKPKNAALYARVKAEANLTEGETALIKYLENKYNI